MGRKNIKDMLVELGICDESSIENFYPVVRDRDDVSILRCRKSGVIFLSRNDHIDLDYYKGKETFGYWSAEEKKNVEAMSLEDNLRRKELIQPLVLNRNWIDIGTGTGGILEEVAPMASSAVAVEPHRGIRENLTRLGYVVYPDISSVVEDNFDLVTLFHVFEHLLDPIESLKAIHRKMADQGNIVIEVPHARDFLISFLDLESFKKFTFWSEHLILHTRQSLQRFLELGGFSEIVISSVQRYPLVNHLHWLKNHKPGGHQKWAYLRSEELDSAYAGMLSQKDWTDTLVAMATK